MKKKVILVLFLSVFMLGLGNVSAATKGQSVGTLYNTLIGYTNQSSGGSVSFWRHTLTSNSSYDTFKDNITLHCLNAGYGSGNLGSWALDTPVNGGTLYLVREFMDGTRKHAYDYGMMTILEKTAKSTTKLEYFEITEAVRVYEMLFGYGKCSGNLDCGILNKWYNSLCNNKKVNEARKAIGKRANTSSCKKSTSNNLNGLSGQFGSISISSIDSKIKSYVLEGVNAVIDYKNKKKANVEISSQRTVTGKEKDKISVSRTIKIENFTTKGAYAKLSVNCKNCKQYGVSYKLFVNDKQVSNNVDLVKLAKNGTGSFNVKVSFSSSNPEICAKILYDLVVNGYDATISRQGAVFTLNSKYSQDFAGITSLDSPTKFSKSLYINLCATDCEELEELCKSGNGIACDRFEDLYGGNCAKCITKVGNVPCQEKESTVSLVEGVEVEDNGEDDKSCNLINGLTPNVKNCIVGGEDIAGNKYQVTNDSLTNYNKSNPYCNIYCTENYDITVPGIQETNSGRYIKLRAGISGTKSCYTNKINTEKFEADLKEKQEAVVNAYNNYLKWREAKRSLPPQSETFPAISVCGGTYTNYFVKFSYSQISNARFGANGQLLSYSTTSGSDEVRSNGSPGSSSCCYSSCASQDKDGKCVGGCTCARYCSSRPRDGSASSVTSRINSNYSSAKTQLNNAIDNLNKVIKTYNSCSSNTSQPTQLSGAKSNIWNMKYDYNAKIGYWYEDQYMDLTTEKFLVTNGAVSKGALTIQTCSGDVDKTYGSCTTGWVANSANSQGKSVFACSGSGDNVSCSTVTANVSTANYVREAQSVTANYELPTQFYTIYPSGKLINENKEGSSPLENALPISLNSQAGVYNYALVVENLGEYYDSEELGRIWGNENSTVVVAQSDDNPCKEQGSVTDKTEAGDIENGAYVCSYKVNCPECNVTCDEDGCVWTECDENGCTVYCTNCVYANGKANFTYRSVTTSDINPNNRNLGKNWNYKENDIKTATELKAAVTTQDILTKGEEIYEDEDEISLTVKLNQSMIRDIKDYNRRYDDNGGYANNSLSCYDYKDSDGQKYENVYCYSSFLDEISTKYNDRLIFGKERVTVNNAGVYSARDFHDKRSKVNNQCESSDPNKCYWTTWTEALRNSNFRVTTTYGISYYYNNYDALGVGPSWR